MATELEGSFIILRKIKYGEADLILHALSSTGEKKSFLARGALKSKKRFGGGVLEPTHHVKFTYSVSGKSDMHTLKEAQLLQGFEGLRLDYDKLNFALLALEFVAKVSLEGDSDSASLYNLLGHLLKALENAKDYSGLKMQFYIKLMRQQGVLELEPWMNPFLQISIGDYQELSKYQSLIQEKSGYFEKVVRHYIETATTN